MGEYEHRLIKIKDRLEDSVCEQVEHLEKADYHELGAAIDMIKDLEEAIYYHAKTEELEEEDEEEEHHKSSYMKRKRYMEAKDEPTKMKELENYMQGLTAEIVEMAHGITPNEKSLLQKKLAALSTKIDQMQ